jgi:hypothetical protein
MKWAGHVARLGERRVAYRVCWENVRETDQLEGLGLDGRIILKWILKKWDRGWAGLTLYRRSAGRFI